MSLKIDIDDKYVITSDQDQFMVNVRSISQGEKWLLKRHILGSDATSFGEVIRAVREFEERMDELLRV